MAKGTAAQRRRKKKITLVLSVLLVLLTLTLTVLDVTGILPVERLAGLLPGMSDNDSSTPAGTGEMEEAAIHIIDCGQGDSILIQLGDSNVLIDGTTGSHAGQVLEYLHKQGIKSLDLMIVTHPHEDHIGGLDDVLGDMPVKQVLMKRLTGSMVPTTKAYERLLKTIKANGSMVTAAEPGQKITVGNGVFTVLGPAGDFEDLNNTSVVVKLDVGSGSALFMGDAEKESETALISRWYDILADVDVLKVGHHGSSTSSSAEFIRFVKPRYAAISVGEGNDYGHPDDVVLTRLEQADAIVSRTDRDGTIVYLLRQNGFELQ